MGVVYHAHDEQLDRPGAIKVVAAAQENEVGRQRLQREAKAAASIRHPHICQIHDIGEERGEPFIAMELLEGESLSARLARGALPVPEAIDLALQVLDALKTLHERGIVHRDLKPSNVFIGTHGAKLLDVGLAAHIGANLAKDAIYATAFVDGDGQALNRRQPIHVAL